MFMLHEREGLMWVAVDGGVDADLVPVFSVKASSFGVWSGKLVDCVWSVLDL